MRIDIITVLPELLEGPFAHSILKRAKDKGLAEVHVHQLREFGAGKHQQVDDYQYGGGAGMVMQCEPLVNCIEALQKERNYDAVLDFFESRTPGSLSISTSSSVSNI